MTIEQCLQKIEKARGESLSVDDSELIQAAYSLASRAHAGQVRANGKPYFSEHCVPVACNVASLLMPASMIAAGLLHDSLEDTQITASEISASCGEDVAFLVEGVTKLGKIKYHGNERHAESLRKFFVAVAEDVRVVILKLCDRLHNVSTLQHVPAAKQKRIADESIQIHAPLASRLGMGKLAASINDLAFPYAEPENYKKTVEITKPSLLAAEKSAALMEKDFAALVKETLDYEAVLDKRIKSSYSLYKKLQKKNWRLDDIHDLVAIRAIVKTQDDCYKILGFIHSKWSPLPGRIKDYIALPKPNGYKSLHTTVMGPHGVPVEIQVRTLEMHAYDEYGLASHHSYKNRNHGAQRESFDWLDQLRELARDNLSPEEYISTLKSDFFGDRIFTITPKGDIIDLPAGATVLDFAYALHTDIGAKAMGGRINGEFKSLDHTIPNEATVEIVTGPRAHVSEKWLEFATTHYAKHKIKKALHKK